MSSKQTQQHVSRLRGEVDGEESAFPLTNGDNTIGANRDSSIHLSVPMVSRRHAVIRVSEGEAVLDDLDSTNGTFVNGIRVRTKVPEEKDWIQAGPAILTFESVSAAEHELAFEVESPPAKPSEDEQPAELPSTELSVRETTRSGWLTSLNDFTAATLWDGRKEIDGALAALGEAVSATVIAHVAWDGHGSPTVAAGAGDLS